MVAAALVVVVGGVAAGCGSSDGERSSPGTASASGAALGTGLGAALASVAGTEATRAAFAWSDVTRADRFADEKTNPEDAFRWRSVPTSGAGVLGASAVGPGLLPVDVSSAREALTIGTGRQVATRLDGVDGAAARQRLLALGGRQAEIDGRDGIVLDGSAATRLPFGLGTALRYTVVDGDRMAYGRDQAGLAAVVGGAPTLAADRGFGAVGACLDDVLAASIWSARPGMIDQADVIGVGVRAPAGPDASVRELLCVHAPTAAAADAIRAEIERRVAGAPVTPDSVVLERKVTRPDLDGGRVVRVELTQGAGALFAGRILQTLGGETIPAQMLNQALGLD